jgi:hypothetical protein
VDKPPSPQAKKTAPKPSKPPSSNGAQSPVGAGGTLTSPTHVASGHDATHNPLRLESVECPEMPPPSPRSYELRAPGGSQYSKGSSMLQFVKQP